MSTTTSLSAHEGQTITLRGCLYNLRASGKLFFPILRDGTGTISTLNGIVTSYVTNNGGDTVVDISGASGAAAVIQCKSSNQHCCYSRRKDE
jgi:aspartyl/asparaginyl-tRNA synthetase